MFWDKVAWVYDLFADFYNGKTHKELCREVVAANVIHLLDEPLKALSELDRVCRPGGKLIIPTYMNREHNGGKTSGFAKVVGKAGADFKRQFTLSSYRKFFTDAGYEDVSLTMVEGRVPCAIAVMTKQCVSLPLKF